LILLPARAGVNSDLRADGYNACGCSGADGYNCAGDKKCAACAKASNAGGTTNGATIAPDKNWLNENFPTLAVGAILGVAVFLITRGNK
jgi:hypothetical protein